MNSLQRWARSGIGDERVSFAAFIAAHGLEAFQAFERANPSLVERIYGETGLAVGFRYVAERS